MRKFPIFSVLIAFCLVSFVGCATAPAATGPTLAGLQAELVELRSDYVKDVATLNEKIAGISGPASDAVTQTELAALRSAYVADVATLNGKITALERQIDELQANGGTSTSAAGTTIGEWGELLDTDGDLELWLERVSGDAGDELMTTQGANDARFDLVVVNLDDDSSHNFKINFRFDPETYVELEHCVSHIFDDDKTKMAGTGGLAFVTSRAGDNYDAVAVRGTLSPLVSYQTNTGRILKGDAEDHTVFLYIEQCTTGFIEWEWDITIDDKD